MGLATLTVLRFGGCGSWRPKDRHRVRRSNYGYECGAWAPTSSIFSERRRAERQRHRRVHLWPRASTEGGRHHRRPVRRQEGAMQGDLGDGRRRLEEDSGRRTAGRRPGVPLARDVAAGDSSRGGDTACPRITAENSRATRFHIPLELKDERVNTPMRVNATDISGNGCYVETIMPLARRHFVESRSLD